MRKLLTALITTLIPLTHTQGAENLDTDTALINNVLEAFHAAAAVGDWDNYFDLMSEDGVFLGTDAAERWTKAEFRAYAGNRRGWVYRSVTRHINLTPDGNSAWFDEILESQSYGTARGTGVLIRTTAGWKISQYHLTFPIPNGVVDQVIPLIQQFESSR